MIEPAKSIAEYNPLSFIVEGIRDPIISGIDGSRHCSTRCWRSPGSSLLGLCAQRPRPATPAAGGLMEATLALPAWRANLATIAALMARAKNELRAGARGGDPGRAGADDLLPRPQRRLRRADPAPRLQHRQLRELHRPGQHAAGSRLHRRRGRRQPRPRHRTGLARPPARLPRPALGPARRHGARRQRPGADPGHLRAGDRAPARRRLPGRRRPAGRLRDGRGDGRGRRLLGLRAGAALQEPVGGAADAGGDDGAGPD